MGVFKVREDRIGETGYRGSGWPVGAQRFLPHWFVRRTAPGRHLLLAIGGPLAVQAESVAARRRLPHWGGGRPLPEVAALSERTSAHSGASHIEEGEDREPAPPGGAGQSASVGT
jgi:hypothetical protein